MALHDSQLIIISVVICGTLSWVATGWVRRFALARDLMDVPNERSSHSVPTPRGGGVAIVLSFLLASMALAVGRVVPFPLALALLGGGLLVAAVGFIDDRRGVSASVRFTAHLLGAGWVLGILGPIAPVAGFGLQVTSAWILLPSMILFITWSVNLFNFMDGIDGIAGIEAVSVALAGAVVAWLAAVPGGMAAPLLLAAAAAGFLIWNWPPARIFMGDAGSGFLGLAVATLAVWHATLAPQLFWSWMILVGCFMVDATTTLLRRVRRGERFHVAHRSHAYQYASRVYRSHLRVSLACGAITLGWLLPWAALVAQGLVDGGLGLLLAYTPLVALVYRYKAGDSSSQI